MSYDQALSAYDTINNQTHYATQYGRLQKTNEDGGILKYKDFNLMPISEILAPQPKKYLSKWFALGDDSYYIGLILASIRQLSATVKSEGPFNSTTR
jgi:hypothetical protein